MPAWPSTLPQELRRTGYRQALPDNLIRTSVDRGPEQTRPRFTSATAPLTGRMTMSNTHLETLTEWFENDIAWGSLAFDFPNPLDLDGSTTISVKFREPPSWSNPGGNNFDVSLEFDIQP